MSTVLTIDVGNTRTKAALFVNGDFKGKKIFPSGDKTLVDYVFKKSPEAAIWSSVDEKHPRIFTAIKKGTKLIKFDAQTKVPIRVKYRTPKTLGRDRLAAAVGAKVTYPERNVLVIDAGTCIKYDIVTIAGHYLGGSIHPGINMRLKAMHQQTARLPLVLKKKTSRLIGTTTQTSIRIGAVTGAVMEMRSMIKAYKKQYPRLIVVLTGGDISDFESTTETKIFALPNIVHYGLYAILKHNM